jgi:hypothetical protein
MKITQICGFIGIAIFLAISWGVADEHVSAASARPEVVNLKLMDEFYHIKPRISEIAGKHLQDVLTKSNYSRVIVLRNRTSAPHCIHLLHLAHLIEANPAILPMWKKNKDGTQHLVRDIDPRRVFFSAIIEKKDGTYIGVLMSGKRVRIVSSRGVGIVERKTKPSKAIDGSKASSTQRVPSLLAGTWTFVSSSRGALSEVEPRMHTIHFARDGTFKCWHTLISGDVLLSGPYTTEPGNSSVQVRLPKQRTYPTVLRFIDLWFGNRELINLQGKKELFKNLLVFTDHQGEQVIYQRQSRKPGRDPAGGLTNSTNAEP